MTGTEDLSKVASFFNAFSNPVRLKILLMLEGTKRPLHIKAVSRELKMDYAAVYRHVKVLQSSGLIEIYEVGRSRVLALAPQASVKELVSRAEAVISGK